MHSQTKRTHQKLTKKCVYRFTDKRISIKMKRKNENLLMRTTESTFHLQYSKQMHEFPYVPRYHLVRVIVPELVLLSHRQQ